MDRVINRVILNFVALCNKLVFCPIFTQPKLKNQVGEGDFTWGGLTKRVRVSDFGFRGLHFLVTRSSIFRRNYDVGAITIDCMYGSQ